MNRTLLLLCSIILLCLATTARAADIIAKSCSNDAVQTAIHSAVNGDRVLIPAGRCIWTIQVTIPSTKGITLQGAGIGVTTIVDAVKTGLPAGTLVITVAPGNAVTHVTAMTWDANFNTKNSASPQIFIQGAGVDAFRIHHIHIKNNVGRGIQMIADDSGTNEMTGLVDHNTFECPNNTTCHSIDVAASYGGSGDGRGGFNRPASVGTNHMTYIEDNTFNYGFANDGALDAYIGARLVFRFNIVINTMVGFHGADSTMRGIHSFEIYRNTFRNSNASIAAFFQRSGSGFQFDNAWTGNYGAGSFNIYRARPQNFFSTLPEGHPIGQCDGSSEWDGNTPGQAGYPCLDQTGHTFTDVYGGRNTLTPVYHWNNTTNGTLFGPSLNEPTSVPYIQANREYYSDAGSTIGITVGMLAARPATCTTGVGYWATDQGTWNRSGGENGVLYTCKATNKWSLYYTPYTYPHPLQKLQDLESIVPSPARPFGLTVQ